MPHSTVCKDFSPWYDNVAINNAAIRLLCQLTLLSLPDLAAASAWKERTPIS